MGAFLQFNCNGVQHCRAELAHFLQTRGILVACLQESKLSEVSTFTDFPNYQTLRRDRPGDRGGGGLISLIHHSISFTHLPTDHLFPGDHIIEHQGFTITENQASLNVYNIYIPPQSCCPSGYRPNLERLFDTRDDDTLIVGDFNAHHNMWYSRTEDDQAAARGAAFAEALDASNLVVLNLDLPTRLPNRGPSSSPDLTIASPHLSLSYTWIPRTTLNSDHLPIVIQLGDWFSEPPTDPYHIFTNFRKARWDGYLEETELKFSREPPATSCGAGESCFRRILLEAAKHHIPAGFIRNHLTALSDEAKLIQGERDRLRTLDPQHPNLSQLEQQLANLIAASRRGEWAGTMESCSHKHDLTKFWRLIETLSGKKQPTPPNQPITFNNHALTDNFQIASAFCKQFTTTVPHTSDRDARTTKRRLRRDHPLDHSLAPFTPEMVQRAAAASSNSTAPGPDGITIRHLKHLGPLGLQYLTNLFNLSLSSADIPSIWKQATIITIPKAGKPRDLGTSYRPISLLPPAVKVLERLLLPQLTFHLPLAESQHGFRSQRSTTSALLPLVQKVAEGFKQPKPPRRTVLMAIDFSKAFDTVNHTKLISSISHSSLPHNTIRWLSAYLRGRLASCRYNGATSVCRAVRAGVPQGSVISPHLFNFFISSYPETCELHSSYADDVHAAVSAVDVGQAAAALSRHASDVGAWAEERQLRISPSKSHITLFTSDTHQSYLDPHVTLNGSLLPLERHPKILGVTFDPHFTFRPHVQSIATRATDRLKIIKALAGTDWGQQKETIVLTFKSLIRSLFTYAAPVWFPNTPRTTCDPLQVIQNTALRIATGCHKRASQGHLHTETQVLPVQDHLGLLCSQYLASALRPTHPSFSTVRRPSGPRITTKTTLQARFGPSIAHHLSNGVTPPSSYDSIISSLHTEAVQLAIRNFPPHRLLGPTTPPPINPEESSLPRPFRSTLAQLRSGHCKALNGYLTDIGQTDDPLCPSCRGGIHDPPHLFSCPSHPTELGLIDLWDRPARTASFISSLPFFDYLPDLPRPPPEPPPSPRLWTSDA